MPHMFERAKFDAGFLQGFAPGTALRCLAFDFAGHRFHDAVDPGAIEGRGPELLDQQGAFAHWIIGKDAGRVAMIFDHPFEPGAISKTHTGKRQGRPT